jgi:hypothetical protein
MFLSLQAISYKNTSSEEEGTAILFSGAVFFFSNVGLPFPHATSFS